MTLDCHDGSHVVRTRISSQPRPFAASKQTKRTSRPATLLAQNETQLMSRCTALAPETGAHLERVLTCSAPSDLCHEQRSCNERVVVRCWGSDWVSSLVVISEKVEAVGYLHLRRDMAVKGRGTGSIVPRMALGLSRLDPAGIRPSRPGVGDGVGYGSLASFRKHLVTAGASHHSTMPPLCCALEAAPDRVGRGGFFPPT
ncbi:hypothetical protein BDW02DRAFT_610742 [Decorospora gaudefroyi]|uniref:Uncharacterized protein n=1 Tax=Decorospora gaudefroyi TaxID=184978 RepID=A0A6A5KQM6_9PLEO|nr:hypothetical protein BDW02DRAFT_610742 [Decorospora gaudefroyi]